MPSTKHPYAIFSLDVLCSYCHVSSLLPVCIIAAGTHTALRRGCSPKIVSHALPGQLQVGLFAATVEKKEPRERLGRLLHMSVLLVY